MLYVTPPSTDAAFHFSAEAYFIEQFPLKEPLFMIWQGDRCAMLGAYQVAQAEVDLQYVREQNIQIVRRQSGGGTIYTDMGTLLYTLILPYTEDVAPLDMVREAFAAPMIRALNKLGIPAVLEGRNDILVAGKKVCGIAQHVRKGWVCSHGSLLYDADLDMLTAALRVDPDKIQSKAIRSIRSRVTNLREHMPNPVSTPEFWALLEEKLTEEWPMQPYTLTETDLAAIGEIYRAKFGNDGWTFGRSPSFSFHNSRRFPSGKVEAFLDIAKGGTITEAAIHGDFLGTVPIRDLETVLEGQPFRRDPIAEVLADIDLRPYLGGISKDELLSCLFDEAAP